MLERATITCPAPAELLAQARAEGFFGPFRLDDKTPGLILDRGDHAVGFFFQGRAPSKLQAMFALRICRELNTAEEADRAIRDPFDPPHVDAVTQESRRNLARLDRNRPEAAE